MRNIRKSSNAFTLIELLVVISIIAMLMAILLPSLNLAKGKAYQIRCMANLKQVGLAFELYTENNEQTYPCITDNPKLWMGRGWRSVIQRYLGGGIDANNPSVLWCPKDREGANSFESTSYAYSMAFYSSPAQINSLVPVEKHSEQFGITPQRQRTTSVARPNAKIFIGEWESNHARVPEVQDWWLKGWWRWDGKRNYLFADYSAQYLKATDIKEARDGNPNPNMTENGIKGSDLPR